MAVGDTSFYGTFTSGTSNKFYSLHQEKNVVKKHWGRIDTEGQIQEVTCNSVEEARKLVEKTGNEKLAKGYQGSFFTEISDIPKYGEKREDFLARIGERG